MSTNAEQRLQQQVDELMIRLAASEDARKNAESELKEYQMDFDNVLVKKNLSLSARAFKAEAEYQTVLEYCRILEQRAEAAEQRILASQEQEPITHLRMRNGEPDWAEDCIGTPQGILDSYDDEIYSAAPLYSQPIIPPELSEVVRERDELRRKLEDERFEHRSYIVQMHERFNNETIALRKQLESMMENAIAMSALNTPPIIIESAKRQTVPEGWKRTRMTNIPHPREHGMRVIGFVVPTEKTEPLGMVSEAIERILNSAAPQPHKD